MKEYLVQLLFGAGAGAVIGVLGLGVVLVYRGSGVVNFAYGAMAMWAAYVYTELRLTGDYLPPLPGRLSLGDPMGMAPALVIGIATAAALGLAAHLLVFRPLRNAPILAKVVASVGILIVLQALVVLKVENVNRVAEPILPRRSWTLFGDVTVQSDRLYFAGLLIVITLVLAALYRYTNFGLATRAAAENEKGATLLGYSSDFLAGTNWVLAGILAGVAGILVAPITGLNPLNYTLFIVPALGAALLGRFTSFVVTAAAGLGIGMVQAEFLELQTDFPDFFAEYGVGMREAFPFVVIVVAIFALGAALPTRGALATGRLPFAPQPRPTVLKAAIALGVASAALFLLDAGWRLALVNSLVGAMLCLSLVVLTGYVGQISLAQMSMAGIAGFMLSRFSDQWGVPFPIAPIMAALVAAAFGVLVGIPALRVRGVNLAIVTLALAVACQEFVFKNPKYTSAITEGAPVPNPELFGIDLGFQTSGDLFRWQFGALALGVLTLLAVAVVNLRRGAAGRRMLAVRSNERAAATAGVNVAATKLLAFGISAFIAGLGGTLIGYQRGTLTDASFGVFASLSILAFAYLGGIASVTGAFVAGGLVGGGLFFYAINRALGGVEKFEELELLLGGIGLIVAAVANPEGVAGAVRKAAGAVRRRAAPRPAPSVTPAPASAPLPGRTAAAPAPSPALLQISNLSVSYGGLRAVDEATIAVAAGRLVGLIGPNGAGKTTVIDAVTGLVGSQGRITLGGRSLDGMRPHRRARAGLARTYQSLELFDDLTVRENLLVAAHAPVWWDPLADVVAPSRARSARGVTGPLERLGLDSLADEYPSGLSQGQRKLVGVARALAATPSVVLLDEPAAGLDSQESKEFGRRLRALVDDGLTVLLVDHDMGLVLEVCDEVYVMDFGRIIAYGTPEQIRNDAAVIAAYLGEALAESPGTGEERSDAEAARTEVPG